MILFDVGANRGDAVIAGLQKDYNVIALEPAPRIYAELVKNFIYNPKVKPIRMAVSDVSYQRIEFYEAAEDGLSTLNKGWLTDETLPYAGKPFRTIRANTITIDSLAEIYGEPDLIKIDVEGAEWSVFKGMTKYHGMLTFEWTDVTLEEHEQQITYLKDLGYKEVGPQFITHHLQEPELWYPIEDFNLSKWVENNKLWWTTVGWTEANLRPTADVGMCWLR